MKTLTRKFAVAAALATFAPAIASACEPEPPRAAVTFGVRARLPGVVVADWGDRDDHWRDRDDHRRDRDDRWRDRDDHGRDREAWREQARVALRAEYDRLDRARADFYAFPHSPWRVRRFEGWYAAEHASLDARWARLG